MWAYVVKVVVSAVLLMLIAECSKRSLLLGALLASVPLTSVIAIVWLYHDTHNIVAIAALSKEIMRLVLPSFIFFIALPVFLLRCHWPFYGALSASLALMMSGYLCMIAFISR